MEELIDQIREAILDAAVSSDVEMMRVLIIDDSPSNVAIIGGLVRSLGARAVSLSQPCVAISEAANLDPDLMVVDHEMPDMTGLELVGEWRTSGVLPDVPIVMITANEEVAVRHAALAMGVIDFLRRPIDPVEVKSRIRNLLRLRQSQRQLADRAVWLARKIADATRTIAAREEEIILRLAKAAERRDSDTGAHIVRMARYCEIVARHLRLPQERCRLIALAAPMHDVGKVGVSDSILLKPSSLSAIEREAIEKHTLYGEEILAGSQSELIQLACEIASSHHEKWDGSGYPRGLVGEEIPLVGRIAAISDVFDALTSARPYKAPWSLSDAKEKISSEAGKHFDPSCVRAFIAGWDEISAIAAQVPHELPFKCLNNFCD